MVYDPSGYTGTHIPAVLRTIERDFSWLSRKMGVSKALVSHVCAGRRNITRSFVTRACAALALPEEALFFGSANMLASTDKRTEHKELSHVA